MARRLEARRGRDRRLGGPLEPVDRLRTQDRRRLPTERAIERRRLAEVVGDELGQRLGAIRCARLEPRSCGGVQVRPLGPGQRAVGDLADEDVAEHVAIGARWTDEVPLDESDQGIRDGVGETGLHGRDPRRAKRPTEDRAHLEHPTGGAIEEIEPCQDRTLDRVRQDRDRCRDGRRIVQPAGILDDRADDLAGIERVAVRPGDDGPDDLRGRCLQEVVDEELQRAFVERLQADRDVVAAAAAPGGSSIEQLWTGEDEHEQRDVGSRLEERLDEVEQAVARPVQILHDEDQRMALGGELEGGPPGGEDRRLVGQLRIAGPNGRRQEFGVGRGRRIPEVDEPGRGRPANLVRSSILIEVEQSEEEGAHGPVGDALPIGEALRGRDRRVGHDRVDRIEEFLEEPALAGARRRDDAHQERPPLPGDPPGDEVELVHVGVAADEAGPPDRRPGGAAEEDRGWDGQPATSRLEFDRGAELEPTARGPDRSCPGDD